MAVSYRSNLNYIIRKITHFVWKHNNIFFYNNNLICLSIKKSWVKHLISYRLCKV